MEWFRRAGGCRAAASLFLHIQMGLLGQTGVWMTPVNALLSEVSAEEGLHWRFLGEYGYSIVILFYVGYFLPFFITVAI